MEIRNFVIVENIDFRDRENKMAEKRVTSLLYAFADRNFQFEILESKLLPYEYKYRQNVAF